MDFEQQERISRLVVLYIQDSLSTEEKQELEDWRKASVRHEEIFLRMVNASFFDGNLKQFVKSDAERESEWQLICGRTLGKKSRRRNWLWRYAAMWVLPLIAGGAVIYLLNSRAEVAEPPAIAFAPGSRHAVLELSDGTNIDLKTISAEHHTGGRGWEVLQDSLKYRETGESITDEEYHILKVPRGGEYTLVLSDGSKVFLNAESSLKYPVRFIGGQRRVKLEGEAYFEVKPDAAKPFIVGINELQVKVLGTSFGVRAYAEEKDVLTTLVSGKVNVATGGGDYILDPSQQAVYDRHSGKVGVAVVDTELFVGWKDGRLVFDNCPLEHILKELGRWYSFEVFYTNQISRQIPFSLNIRKHENFAQVLELMQNTGRVDFEINRNTVIVK